MKLAQLVLGAVCVGLVSYYMSKSFTSYSSASSAELFFLLMTVSFLIGTFCLLMSCLCSLSTGGIISKTMYELVFHSVAFVLYLAASVCFLIAVTDHKYSSRIYDPYMAAAVSFLLTFIVFFKNSINYFFCLKLGYWISSQFLVLSQRCIGPKILSWNLNHQ